MNKKKNCDEDQEKEQEKLEKNNNFKAIFEREVARSKKLC